MINNSLLLIFIFAFSECLDWTFLLNDDLKNVINIKKCTFIGIYPQLTGIYETITIVCPQIKDIYYGWKFISNYNVTWELINNNSTMLIKDDNTDRIKTKDDNLWILKFIDKDIGSKYICTVKNETNCNTAIITLNKPFNTKRCKKVTVRMNTDTSLFCNVYLIFDYIVWYKDNKIINITNDKYSIRSKFLVIKNITHDDKGKYICNTYHNDTDIVNSRCINLDTKANKVPDFELILDNITHVKIGNNSSIDCKIIHDSNYHVIGYWKYNNSIITDSMHLQDYSKVINNGKTISIISLYIRNVDETYINRRYECYAYDENKKEKSKTTELIM
nr:IFN-alpha/beta-receptor-like secreted glycoprotein [Wadden Sea poxvirus]